MSRNFSVKVHGHLKILIHLVNNLIESDDFLELINCSLKMPDLPLNDTKEVNLQMELQNKPNEVNFTKILKTYEEENKKLVD